MSTAELLALESSRSSRSASLERPMAGYIGLRNHDPGEVVWFKEVSARPLPTWTEGASGKVAE